MKRSFLAVLAAALLLPAPAGATLAYLKGAEVFVSKDDGTAAKSLGFALPSTMGGRLKLAPGGGAVAVDDPNRNVAVVRGRTRRTVFKHASSFAWLDGTTLALARATRFTYEVWLLGSTGAAHRIYTHGVPCGPAEGGCQFPAVSLAGSPNGRRIAIYGDVNAGLTVIGRDGHTFFRQVSSDFSTQTVGVAWRPGTAALAAAEANTKSDGGALVLVSASGGRRVLFRSSTRVLVSPSWSPDGKQLAFGRPAANDSRLQLARYPLAAGRAIFRPGSVAVTTGGIGAWISPTRWLVGYDKAIRAVDPSVPTKPAPALVKTTGAFDWQPSR
jgi:hypothetical protein